MENDKDMNIVEDAESAANNAQKTTMSMCMDDCFEDSDEYEHNGTRSTAENHPLEPNNGNKDILEMGQTQQGDYRNSTDEKLRKIKQEIDYLTVFLDRYRKIPDEHKDTLGLLLARIIMEKLYFVYNLSQWKISLNEISIRPFNLDPTRIDDMLRLISNFEDAFKKIIKTVFNEYLDKGIEDDVVDAYLAEEDPQFNLSTIKAMEEDTLVKKDLKKQAFSVYERKKKDYIDYLSERITHFRNLIQNLIDTFPERFVSALFMNFFFGVEVIPSFTLDFLNDRDRPFNTRFINTVLFFGFKASKPDVTNNLNKDRINYIMEILQRLSDDNELLTDLAEKSIIRVIQGKYSNKTLVSKENARILREDFITLFWERNLNIQYELGRMVKDKEIPEEERKEIENTGYLLTDYLNQRDYHRDEQGNNRIQTKVDERKPRRNEFREAEIMSTKLKNFLIKYTQRREKGLIMLTVPSNTKFITYTDDKGTKVISIKRNRVNGEINVTTKTKKADNRLSSCCQNVSDVSDETEELYENNGNNVNDNENNNGEDSDTIDL